MKHSAGFAGLFDREWYLRNYPDVLANGMDPVDHYICHGASEERDPDPLFDTGWYLAHNPDVAESGMNPLEHYVKFGASEGRDPNPLFDTGWYFARNPDVAASGMNPLEHYLKFGANEGRDPNPLFDDDWYLAWNPNVGASEMNPLEHYLKFGANEGRDPNPLFDSDWYLCRYPDVAASGMNPLEHYLKFGANEGRDPHPLFDTDWYLSRYPDVAPARMNPLFHYISSGAKEGRDPHPLFDTRYYQSQIVSCEALDLHGHSTKSSSLKEEMGPGLNAIAGRNVTYVFTSICLNYLPKAKVLGETLKRHNPEIRFHLLINEPAPEETLRSGNWFDELTTIDDLPISGKQGWIFRHSLVELSTAVKGVYMLQLLERSDCKMAFYFDPDIAVFSTIDPLIKALETASILLTPHLTAPEFTVEAIMDNEICSLKHGIYNLGFLGVRVSDEGLRFARWWRDRLLHFCRADIPGGLFTDQRWVDLAPAFFPGTQILRHPGCNVATWNLNNRQIEGCIEDGFTVNGESLIFYHFSGFDSGAQEIMLKKYGAKMPAANELREWYIANTERTEDLRFSGRPWLYNSFSNGESITPGHRSLFRDRLDLRIAFPDPFDAANPASSYYHWYESEILARHDSFRQPAALPSALEHYLRIGAGEGLNPNPCFDGKWYLDRYPEVANAGMNPFLHYVIAGAAEGKNPGPRFYPECYRKHSSKRILLQNALAHYLSEGMPSSARIDCIFDVHFDESIQKQIVDWAGSRSPVILLISHFGGGGTEKHLDDLVKFVGNEAAFLRLIPSSPDRIRGTVLLTPIGVADTELCFDPIHQFDELLGTLKACKLDRVHIHHALGNEHYLRHLIQQLGTPFDFTVHDYYVLSPSPHLIGVDSRFVGEDLSANEDKLIAAALPGKRPPSLASWQREHRWLVEDADRVICPSRDVARRLDRHFDGWRAVVAAHPEDRRPSPKVRLEAMDPNENCDLRIAILGGLGPHKGMDVVLECARVAIESHHPITFDLIGSTCAPLEDLAKGGIWCSGAYQDDDVQRLISERKPHLFWFPALCPETFSYTLSIAMEAGLPLVAPNLGSFQNRVSGREWTWICPWERTPSEWIAFFLHIRNAHLMTSIQPNCDFDSAPPNSDFYKESYLTGIER